MKICIQTVLNIIRTGLFRQNITIKTKSKRVLQIQKQIERIILKVIELPNILEVQDIVLTGETNEPTLQILCKNDLRKLAIRNFSFKYIKRKGFIE